MSIGTSDGKDPYLWQHPLSSGLHAQAAIMNPQDQIGSLPVSAFAHVKLGLIRRRGSEVSVQAEFDGHAAGLSTDLNERKNPASAANTYVADVSPRPGIVRLPPVDEAGKRLNNLDRLPAFGEGADGEIVGNLLARSVHLGLEELGTGHEESGEQKRAP